MDYFMKLVLLHLVIFDAYKPSSSDDDENNPYK